MNYNPIGMVRSPVKEGVDRDWGNVISEIHINPDLADGLLGIESFSHIIVIFELHQFIWSPQDDLVRRPQGRMDMPLLGVFAQRAKHRPNPIGVTSVRLLGHNGSILSVKGLDAVDETPVLDIKPYFPQYDRVEDLTYPEWVDRIMVDYF